MFLEFLVSIKGVFRSTKRNFLMNAFEILYYAWAIKRKEWIMPQSAGHLPIRVTKTLELTTVEPELAVNCPISGLPFVFQYDEDSKTIRRLCLRLKCPYHDDDAFNLIRTTDPFQPFPDVDKHLRERNITVDDIIACMQREEIIDNDYEVHLFPTKPLEEYNVIQEFQFQILNERKKCNLCKGNLLFTFFPQQMEMMLCCAKFGQSCSECNWTPLMFDMIIDTDKDLWVQEYFYNEGMYDAMFDWEKYLFNYTEHRLTVLGWYTGIGLDSVKINKGAFSKGVYKIFVFQEDRPRCVNTQCPGFLNFSLWTIQNLITRTCSVKTCPYAKWKRYDTPFQTIEDLYPPVRFQSEYDFMTILAREEPSSNPVITSEELPVQISPLC